RFAVGDGLLHAVAVPAEHGGPLVVQLGLDEFEVLFGRVPLSHEGNLPSRLGRAREGTRRGGVRHPQRGLQRKSRLPATGRAPAHTARTAHAATPAGPTLPVTSPSTATSEPEGRRGATPRAPAGSSSAVTATPPKSNRTRYRPLVAA